MTYLKDASKPDITFDFTPKLLCTSTAALAKGFEAISIFSGDDCSAEVVTQLKNAGVKFIVVRATGYDNVDIPACNEAHIQVANVPEYSPNAIAEHAVAMMLAMDRQLIRASQQVAGQNFTLDNLVGFDLNRKKVGIIGAGRIGRTVAKIMHGFGCTLMAYDVKRDQSLEHKYNVFYTGLNTLCSMCDIITIHLPLNEQTRHLINKKNIRNMKKGVMLINTARGAVINTQDVIDALQEGHIGYFGMDVYEFEKGIFCNDLSNKRIDDPMLMKLKKFPNVLITPHQGFATHEALTKIAETTFKNLMAYKNHSSIENEITYHENHILRAS